MATSTTDADYYTYLIGREVAVDWCDREITGTVIDVDAVAGFNLRSIEIRISLGDPDGAGADPSPTITVGPDALLSDTPDPDSDSDSDSDH